MPEPSIMPRPGDAPPDHASLAEVERWLRARRAGASFSPDDVYLAASIGLKEIRAVTPAFTFSMIVGSLGWLPPSQIETMVNIAHDHYAPQMAMAARRGRVSVIQATADELHIIWTELERVMGVQYNRRADQ